MSEENQNNATAPRSVDQKQACSARTGKHLFIGDRGYYCGRSRKIPSDVLLEVVESKMPVAVCFRADDGKTYWFSGRNFSDRRARRPSRYAAGLLRQYCGWYKIPPPEYIEWAYNVTPDECHMSPEMASWCADCHETNHDDEGRCVGEMWPGYVTFEAWEERCAKRNNSVIPKQT